MLTTRKPILFTLCLLTGGLFGACGGTNNNSDGSASDGSASDGSATDGGGTGSDGAKDGVTRDGSAGDAPAGDAAKVTFTALMIVDKDIDMVTCGTTNGPGADIDAVELRTSLNATIGFGLKGSASYATEPTVAPCKDAMCKGGVCKYSNIAFKARTEGPKNAVVNPTTDDEGYFSLNNGRLQLQIGDALGDGPAKTLESGMQIKVWEVDQTYKTAANGCICVPEEYEVYILTAPGTSVGAVKLKSTTLESVNSGMCGGTVAGGTLGCGTTVFVIP